MPVTLSILDETTAGTRRHAGTLTCESVPSTLRDIIRLRVQQEVERLNRSDTRIFQGLVQPEQSERMLNGERPTHPILDWEQQYARAIKAFRGNGFLVLVDDRQITDLDEALDLRPQTQVTFLRLVALIGG